MVESSTCSHECAAATSMHRRSKACAAPTPTLTPTLHVHSHSTLTPALARARPRSAARGVAGDHLLRGPTSPPATIAAVALMGRYEYAAAEAEFAAAVRRAPDWLDARINLAIATLNRQNEGDERLALDILADVLEIEPDEPRALYTSAVLHWYLGEIEPAKRSSPGLPNSTRTTPTPSISSVSPISSGATTGRRRIGSARAPNSIPTC